MNILLTKIGLVTVDICYNYWRDVFDQCESEMRPKMSRQSVGVLQTVQAECHPHHSTGAAPATVELVSDLLAVTD